MMNTILHQTRSPVYCRYKLKLNFHLFSLLVIETHRIVRQSIDKDKNIHQNIKLNS